MAKVNVTGYDDSEPSSMKDAGYKSARGTETIAMVARYVQTQFPDFLDKQTDEAIEGLSSGWALRFQELHVPVAYSSEWLPMKDGGNVATLPFALAYSQQAFGQLRSTEPRKHAIVKDLRDTFSKYRSNQLKAILTAMRQLNPIAKVRAVTANFDQWAVKALKVITDRATTAVSRGDTTAHVEKVKRCNAAWLAEFNKK
jgi:hypothetical protein